MTDPRVSMVRRNLLTVPGYTPYCGAQCSSMPRTRFDGEQFKCGDCGWSSSFEAEFIQAYTSSRALPPLR